MEYILYYIALCYIILTTLLVFTTRKYLDSTLLTYILIFILYLIAFILVIIGTLNDVNIIDINTETTKYLNELDFAVEIPEITENKQKLNNRTADNSISKFIDLFNVNSYNQTLMNEKLNNNYYYKFKANKSNPNFYNSGIFQEICSGYITTYWKYNTKLASMMECFNEILDEYAVIQNELLNK